MTRYNTPLPHAQVPPSQGRPAQGGHHPQHHPQQQPPHYGEPALSGWPPAAAPQGQAPGGGHRASATPSYPDLGYPDHETPQHDPYAALRPDGYGGAPQPSAASGGDPYGLAGYTAPKGAATPGFGNRPAPPASYDPYGAAADPYGTPGQPTGGYQQPGNGYGGQTLGRGAQHAPAGTGYAPAPTAAPSSSFSDYAMPQPGGYGALRADPPSPHGDHWGGHDPHGQGLGLDPHDYAGQEAYADLHGHGQQWGMDGAYGVSPGDPQMGHDPYHGQQGALDQSYADDDAMYDEEPARKGWKKVAALMACTVLVGGGLAYGFSGLMGPGGGETPPLVKGAEGPSKVKPSDPGGKRFDHADSKIMGRLGEGSSSNDASGVRRVPVVQVGRDGSIRPPPSGRETQAINSVPGLTVIDNFGGAPNSGGPPPSVGSPAVAGPSPTRPAAPKVQMVTGSDQGGSDAAPKKSAAAASPPPARKTETPKKVAAATPSPSASSSSSSSASTGPRPTGAGYVAVLASVPVSASSRIDALTQFADMQQKYGNILSNKTPDIQEANLGAKGTYHRLLVGPPGSRDSANSVCNQLKAQGYSGCWITAY